MGGSLQMNCIKRKMLILCKATSMRFLLSCVEAILCGRKSSPLINRGTSGARD